MHERLVQSFLPRGRAHAGRVAGELAEACEQLLARLLRAQPAELDGMDVHDSGVREPRCEERLVELRVAARRGEAADIDQGLDAGVCEAGHELVDRPAAVTDRVDRGSHTRRIAALTGKESTWPRR
jgi:hypothetical protein